MGIPLGIAAPFVGGLIDTAVSAYGQKESIEASKEMAQNKHQWEVADLKAAGLNPILSAGGGSSPGAGGGAGIRSNLSNSAKESVLIKRQADLLSAQTQQAQGVARRENATAERIEALGPMSDFMESASKGVLGGLPEGWQMTRQLPAKMWNLLKNFGGAASSAVDVRVRRKLEELERQKEMWLEERERKQKKDPLTIYIRKGQKQ